MRAARGAGIDDRQSIRSGRPRLAASRGGCRDVCRNGLPDRTRNLHRSRANDRRGPGRDGRAPGRGFGQRRARPYGCGGGGRGLRPGDRLRARSRALSIGRPDRCTIRRADVPARSARHADPRRIWPDRLGVCDRSFPGAHPIGQRPLAGGLLGPLRERHLRGAGGAGRRGPLPRLRDGKPGHAPAREGCSAADERHATGSDRRSVPHARAGRRVGTADHRIAARHALCAIGRGPQGSGPLRVLRGAGAPGDTWRRRRRRFASTFDLRRNSGHRSRGRCRPHSAPRGGWGCDRHRRRDRLLHACAPVGVPPAVQPSDPGGGVGGGQCGDVGRSHGNRADAIRDEGSHRG